MHSGNRRYWLFQASGWGIFVLINLFFAFLFNQFSWVLLARLGVYVALGIGISHAMRYVVLRYDVLIKPLQQQILQFIFFTLLFSMVLGALQTISEQWLDLRRNTEWSTKFFSILLSNVFSSLILLFIWNCLYFMYHYIEKSRRQQLDTLQLEALVRTLELKTIKAHINPHFIFNALNSIRALIDENPARARRAITELSNILRNSMQTEKVETVSFGKELSIVKDYLALENMRFEDRLKVEYDIDEDTLERQVPPMMLQTLVENAIKHGISRQVRGGLVRVISDFKDDYHELAVQNTGLLNGTRNSEGFGISSTQDRLSLLYGEKARFEIRQLEPQIVEARVLIPVEPA